MFGGANLHLFSLVCVICFFLTNRSGLYSSQMNIFGNITQDTPSHNS